MPFSWADSKTLWTSFQPVLWQGEMRSAWNEHRVLSGRQTVNHYLPMQRRNINATQRAAYRQGLRSLWWWCQKHPDFSSWIQSHHLHAELVWGWRNLLPFQEGTSWRHLLHPVGKIKSVKLSSMLKHDGKCQNGQICCKSFLKYFSDSFSVSGSNVFTQNCATIKQCKFKTLITN